jgi:hypothetical protein
MQVLSLIPILFFSVVGPVSINNRVKAWNLQQLPPDWREQRQRWNRLNAIRVVLIALAFSCIGYQLEDALAAFDKRCKEGIPCVSKT